LKNSWLLQSAKQWDTGSSVSGSKVRAGSSFFRVVRETVQQQQRQRSQPKSSEGNIQGQSPVSNPVRLASDGSGLMKDTDNLVVDDHIADAAEDKWKMLMLFMQQACFQTVVSTSLLLDCMPFLFASKLWNIL
jgi:hypothetical protein